jgi:ABC-type antimicrobial peptide transport system permease subunit
LDWSDGVTVSVYYRSAETGEAIVQDWKIAGVFFRVNEWDATAGYKLMVGEKFMDTYRIYRHQGEYTKILFSQKSIKNGGNDIVGYLTAEGGLALNWYNNPILTIISKNEVMIRQIADLFLYIALALASVSVFMLYNYISTSIASKRRSVGVLRALGAGGKDILRTFLIESLIIAIINGALACVFSALGCLLVNSYVMNTMNIFVAFALFGVRQVVIIIAVSFLTAFLSSALPIVKISKKKPVELIRRS